jgi:hypothetical protein
VAVNIPIMIKNIPKGTKIIRSITIKRYVNDQVIQHQNALYLLSFVKNDS